MHPSFQAGRCLYIAFDSEVDQESCDIKLRIIRSYLLHQLAARLETLNDFRMFAPLVKTRQRILKNPPYETVANSDSRIVAELLSKKSCGCRMLWGPPGAGKTYAIAHFIRLLLEKFPDQKILLVAPSNRAVDVALRQVGELLEEEGGVQELISNRRILRYGYPRLPAIVNRPEFLGPATSDELTKPVKELNERIGKAEKEQAGEEELSKLRAERLAALEDVKNAVEDHIRESRLVATTCTLASLDSAPISKISWNTVIVDEVTMVTPAMCAYLAELTKDEEPENRRVLLAGDPRQLGPVFEGNGASAKEFDWLGRDIFSKSQVSKGSVEQRVIHTDDYRLARITSQRRCTLNIWTRVERFYPEVENLTEEKELADLINLPPCPGEAVVVMDTSNLSAKCKQSGHSWENQFTAECALQIAFSVAAESPKPISIAVITPYRAQVRLLRKWIRELQQSLISLDVPMNIEAGTVHQFQGSDADVVIFDVVDGAPRTEVGKLLRDDDGIRLVNVAVTRAKGKFILIADKSWCQEYGIEEHNSILGEIILGKKPAQHLEVVKPTERNGNANPDCQQNWTYIEKRLFAALQSEDIPAPVDQHLIIDNDNMPVSRADFAFVELKYAIYCDGKEYHLPQEKWESDWRKRNKLTELGWVFSVFTGSQINRSAEGCAAQIAKTYRRLEQERGRQAG